MNRSVKSKTIRHDCHLLVRAGKNHLKTLVFLLPLFKSNRHKLDSIKGDELCFLLGFAKIIVWNRLLFSIKKKKNTNHPADVCGLLTELSFSGSSRNWPLLRPVQHLEFDFGTLASQHHRGTIADPRAHFLVTHAVTVCQASGNVT